jgi:hypothetical protein
MVFMADLIFNKQTGALSWPTKSLKWKAVSGPFGAGALPSGLYDVNRKGVSQYTKNIHRSFQDVSGRGFFVPIYPKFTTERGKMGGRLGIHPDGGSPGTLGCIGLNPSSDTAGFYNALSRTPLGVQLILRVE